MFHILSVSAGFFLADAFFFRFPVEEFPIVWYNKATFHLIETKEV